MFEVAWSELLIVIIVAILVVGPKELPGLLRSAGRMIGKLRRQADEFRKHFDDAVREAGAADLQREMQALRHHNPLTQIRDTIEQAARDIDPQKPALPASDPASDPFNDDDLPPPPPLPPRSDTATSSSTAAPVAPQPKPADPAPAPATKEASGNGVDHEGRVNGEHRPTTG
jgi:sec-independent protein translocase protein TatB